MLLRRAMPSVISTFLITTPLRLITTYYTIFHAILTGQIISFSSAPDDTLRNQLL